MITTPWGHRRHVTRVVTKKLEALGDTPDDIARSLEELGIKGLDGEARMCPLAIYLDRELKSVRNYDIAVRPKNVELRCPGFFGVREFVVPLSDMDQRFITLFDRGTYPQLDASKRA